MCLGIPGELVGFVEDQPDLAVVDVSGVRRRINIGLLRDGGLEIGDWVLVHMGFALAELSAEEANAVRDYLAEMGRAGSGEIDAGTEPAV